MNILLWVVQVALALFYFAGGSYKVFQFDELAKMPQGSALSRGQWSALGLLEILCGVLLLVPSAVKWMPVLTPLAATVLVLESLALAVFFGQYSLAVAATNPLVYVVVGGVLAAFIAYGRFALTPS